MPCLRRAQSLAYTDADEDAERLLSFADGPGGSADGEEWVETHAGRKAATNPGADSAALADIPDDDDDDVSKGVAGLSLSGAGEGDNSTPNLDDIPDMEEDDLEEGDEATAKVTPAPAARWVFAIGMKMNELELMSSVMRKKHSNRTCCKSGHMML